MCAEGVPTREGWIAARAEYGHIRGRMIALQEELDWDVYRRYGLLDDAEAAELIAEPVSVPELRLGERAFEIVLARRMAEARSRRSGSSGTGPRRSPRYPRTGPSAYKAVVAKRIETIENRRDIALIERPECKRRWQSEPWEVKERSGAYLLASGPVRGPSTFGTPPTTGDASSRGR